MDIESFPSQPRYAALASCWNALDALPAPFTLSLAPASRAAAAASPLSEAGLAPPPSGGGRKTNAGDAGSVSPSSSSSAKHGAADCGTSTRKQQEVTKRPREKGRFVKRAPACLPISAFKPLNRNEAAEVAEAAEEALLGL